jgi:hypothetical protein
MIVTAIVALAAGVATYAVVRSDPYAARTGRSFSYDMSSLYEIDPSLVQFEQTAQFAVDMQQVRAVDAVPTGEIFVAGDRAVFVFTASGKELKRIACEGRPSCLEVAGEKHTHPGRMYVGSENKIEVFDQDREPLGSWDAPGDGVILTSITAAENEVFVADAGNRVILRYDLKGNLIGKIGGAGADREFTVPSSYFDIAASAEGTLHVANPGVLRIETLTPEGQLEVRWGEGGSTIKEFFGCCNPSHFAVLPDGAVVTSEKGVARIKVYSPYGEFRCVVAGPKQLGVAQSELGDPRSVRAKADFDVAVDAQGQVLVLDPREKAVRVFSRIETADKASGEQQTGSEEEGKEEGKEEEGEQDAS